MIDRSQINETSFLNSHLFDFIKDNNNLDAYLALDDFNLYTHFNHWRTTAADEILKELCKNLILRKPYKMIKETENDSLFDRDKYKIIGTIFNSPEKENAFFMEDEYLNVAYKDSYLLGEKSSDQAQHIWLKYSDNELKELAEVSPIIGSLKNEKFRKRRAYIHRDFEEKLKIKIK